MQNFDPNQQSTTPIDTKEVEESRARDYRLYSKIMIFQYYRDFIQKTSVCELVKYQLITSPAYLCVFSIVVLIIFAIFGWLFTTLLINILILRR